MNIALIASGALRSKKEATWLTLFLLAKEYRTLGHTVIICAEKHVSLPAIEEVEGIKVYRWNKGKIFNAFRTLSRIAKQENIKFDVIHGFSTIPILGTSTFLAGLAFPNAKKVHTIKSYSKYLWGRYFSFGFLNPVNFIDIITVSTEKLKEHIVAHGFFKRKIKIIKSPINLEKFKPRNKEVLKKKYGFTGKKLIFYYGALRKEKGVDDLLKAVPAVVQEFPNTRVFLAIRSQVQAKREGYIQLTKELGIEQHVTISLDDLPVEEYVSMADMVVLAYPTLIGTEGNPSCLLESMAVKTPVVTTDLPELREIVTPDQDVLMARPDDVESLSLQMERLLSNLELGKKLAENAYTKSKQFDVKVIAKQFLELYTNTNQ